MKIIEKFNLRDRKNLLLGILIIGVLSITIAFAALSTNLRINGVANTAQTKWNIHFDNWTNVTQNTSSGHSNTAQYDDSKITQILQPNITKIDKVNVILKQPGDYIRYTFKIKNDGTIDGKLDRFSHNIICEENKECNMISYTIECADTNNNNNALETGYILEKNKSVDCALEVKYKDQTNNNTAGSNQKYVQGEVEASIDANWTWVQGDGSNSVTPSPTPVAVKCENGQLIDNTGWCLTNPGASLKNQKFIYYKGDTAWSPGWHELYDLYGKSQEYYADNDGYAHIGWLTYNGNRYYFSDEDDDGNNYVNCNLLKNTTKQIENKCYSFDSTGIATEVQCESSEENFDRYQTFDYSNWRTITSPTLVQDWNVYIKENTSSVQTREVCVKLSNGQSFCVNPYLSDCNYSNGACTNSSGYTMQKINEAISKGARQCGMYTQSICDYNSGSQSFECCFDEVYIDIPATTEVGAFALGSDFSEEYSYKSVACSVIGAEYNEAYCSDYD